MRVIFFGSGSFGIPLLRCLVQLHQVPLVVTQPDRPAGRGRKLIPTPIHEFARSHGVEVLAVADADDDRVVGRLLGVQADVGVVVAFGQKLRARLLNGITRGCINAHASLLPAYRGAAPIQWAIIRGERKTGVTVFKLVERMDAGPILTSRWTSIKPDETADELHDRLAGIAVDAVRGALELYADDPDPCGEAQDESSATTAPKLRKEDGLVDFAGSAQALAWRICGLWSWPGARCRFRSASSGRTEEVRIARARPAAGEIADVHAGVIDKRMFVGTGDGMLELLEIQPAGGKLMTWPDFVHGRRVQAGDRFEQADPHGL